MMNVLMRMGLKREMSVMKKMKTVETIEVKKVGNKLQYNKNTKITVSNIDTTNKCEMIKTVIKWEPTKKTVKEKNEFYRWI